MKTDNGWVKYWDRSPGDTLTYMYIRRRDFCGEIKTLKKSPVFKDNSGNFPCINQRLWPCLHEQMPLYLINKVT